MFLFKYLEILSRNWGQCPFQNLNTYLPMSLDFGYLLFMQLISKFTYFG